MESASSCSPKIRELNDIPSEFQVLRADTLRSKIECPVCLEIPIPPILLCSTGHSICGKCRKKTERCPACRLPYSGARNYVLEDVAALLQVNCKNSGCTAILNPDSIKDHLSECEYRAIPCTSGDCGNKLIDFTEFLHHLVRVHNRTIRFTSSWYDLYCEEWDAKIFDEKFKACCVPQPLVQAGLTLMVNIAVEYSTMFIWVAGMMAQEEASKYLANLKLDNAHDRSKIIQWTLGIVPIHKDGFEFVKNTTDCASLPLRTLRAYSKMSESNTHYTFSMKLLVSEKDELSDKNTRSNRFESSFVTLMDYLGL